MSQPRAVVFDMGGVLVDLGPLASIFDDLHESPDELWARWLASPTVRDFEMGRCSIEEFGERFVVEACLGCAPGDLIGRFLSWPNGLFAGAVELVQSIPIHVTTAVLSNTNSLHWELQRDAPIMQSLFNRRYLSYELGLAKPDAAIFEHVIADLGFEPARIVFLDDNEINVAAARAIGLDAVTVAGIDECRAALATRGLLAGS